MRKILIMMTIAVLTCSSAALAADAIPTKVFKGNQGYIYKSASKECCSCRKKSTSPSPNLFRDIAHGVKKADNWIRENMW